MRQLLLYFLLITLSLPLGAQLLFPGDLNNDGRANHLDLLPVAVAYGRGGPPRELADLEWIPQPTTSWESTLPRSGVDLAFVDSNGDGQIDSLDIDAIAFSYDSTQMAAIPAPIPYDLVDTFHVSSPPLLRASFNQSLARPGDTIRIQLDWEVPNSDVFPPERPPVGLAFRITFDPSFFANSSIRLVPNSDASGLMYVAAASTFVDAGRRLDPGVLEMAVGAKNNNDLLDSQPIAEIIIIIEDMILLMGNPEFQLEGPLVLNAEEEVIAAAGQIDSLLITHHTSPQATLEIPAYPNPFQDWLAGQLPQSTVVQVEAWNSLGQLQATTFSSPTGNWTFDTSSWPTGLYHLTSSYSGYSTHESVVKY